MMDESKRILVIVPAFNEGPVIGDLIREIKGVALPALPVNADICIIDDGSSDNTSSEARLAGARVISLLENLGYGYALKTGYQAAWEEDVDFLVQMDGDGQHAAQSIPDLLAPLLADKCDLVIGSRALSDVPYPMPFLRFLGQHFFTWVLFRMCGLRIQDPTSGFQVLNRRALWLCLSEDFPGDYPDTNALLYLKLQGIRILEMPAVFRVNKRKTSMHNGFLQPFYYVYSMLFSMIVAHWRHRQSLKRRPRT